MTRRRLPRPAAGLLAVALAAVVAACGQAGPADHQQAAVATFVAPTVRPTATPVPRSVVIPEAYRGTWTSDIKGTSASSGTWTLRITEHDAELKNPIADSDSEFFSLNPDTATTDDLELAEDPDCPAGHYTWTLKDGRLTFATAADTCEDRLAVLTTGPWTKQP